MTKLLDAPLLALACAGPPADDGGGRATDGTDAAAGRDPHSFARPEEVQVTHLDLYLDVDFAARQLVGRASLTVDDRTGAGRLLLDTRGLDVRAVTLDDGTPAEFSLGEEVEHLGRPLEIALPPGIGVVHVDYATSPDAAALLWLTPEQTAGGEHPFLFTQSQAILARTWVPCQDTPGVRMTYTATVRVPPELMAVMSAENPTTVSADGVYTFVMPQPVPSYLLALAVGDLEFRPLGERSGVYAEPALVEEAAWEFADTPRMIADAERLYGPYRWGRYDILVLPPSFPYGGMENPRLTFATPTILAGDRSLVALIAHELAHSWSGNLVTNATWDDFWLNEGFTTYFESRIMEAVYGDEVAEMLAALGLGDLRRTVARMGEDDPDTRLHLDLAGRDPDDGMTDIAYEKGRFFLRTLEETVGRERWDAFLGRWFSEHAFSSVTTAEFVDFLDAELLTADEAAAVGVERWIYQPGLPDDLPEPDPARFAAVDAARSAWLDGAPAPGLATDAWTTHEWLHFLRGLPEEIDAERLAELDDAFGLTGTGNSEVATVWYAIAVRRGYHRVDPALEEFLLSVGRRKFLAPLYGTLAATPEGKRWARRVYARARPGYHSVSTGTVDAILDWQGEDEPARR